MLAVFITTLATLNALGAGSGIGQTKIIAPAGFYAAPKIASRVFIGIFYAIAATTDGVFTSQIKFSLRKSAAGSGIGEAPIVGQSCSFMQTIIRTAH